MKLSDLTIEEKLRLLCGVGAWHTAAFGDLPAVSMSDGPVGLRTMYEAGEGVWETYKAVVYPSVQVLANTWSEDCARLMGECLGCDAADRQVDLLLAPGVNVKRHPLNGRNFEYFSEDPFLAGTLAKAYVEGVQSQGVGACVKHFCCNNMEFDRLHQTSDVDERTLREIYYKPFEIACEAHPVTVMCSYNRINGTYGSEYKKGFDVLRREFGFDGAVISDWDAVRDRTAAAKAGLDVEMPFNERNYQRLVEDFKAGAITEEEVDACAARVLELEERMVKMRAMRCGKHDEAARIEAAKRIQAEGTVLLKNEGVLPLAAGTKAAVCGYYARPDNVKTLAGGGSSLAEWLDPAFDLPSQLAARGVENVYEQGCAIDTVWSVRMDMRRARENAAERAVNIVCVGTGSAIESEEKDRTTMRLPLVQERLILETAEENENTVVVLFAGAAVDMSAWIDKVAAVVYAGFVGMGSDAVLADLLTGARNFSGKLSETFPFSLGDLPAAETFVSAGVTRYQEGLDVGYRYFTTYKEPVLFPFGFGSSYSEFAYADLALQATETGVRVRFAIENVSRRDGMETAQVYVHPCAPLVYRPDRELKHFAKRGVAAGEKIIVDLTLPLGSFAHWSASQDRWEVSDGVYEILVGASCEDIRLRAKIRVQKGRVSVL